MPHNEFLKRIRKTLYVGGNPSSMDTPSISRPFAHYAAEIFSEPHLGHSLNRLNYVTVTNLDATPCSLILAMIYLERLQDSDPMYTRKITPTELFIVSMLVSTKFYCGYDEDVYVSEWAEQGEMSPDRLKQLELELLSALNWNLYVSNVEFFEKLKYVEMELAKRQGLERGWLTYTELHQLIPSLTIAKAFVQYSSVFMVSYAASVVTIAGAFFLASQVPGTALYHSRSKLSATHEQPKADLGLDRASPMPTMESNDTDNEFDEALVDRLKCPFDIDTEPAAPPNAYRNESVDSILLINIPQRNSLEDITIKRSGINLRSFLDHNTDDDDHQTDYIVQQYKDSSWDFKNIQFADNLTDWNVLDEISHSFVADHDSCQVNRYGLFRFWMKFF